MSRKLQQKISMANSHDEVDNTIIVPMFMPIPTNKSYMVEVYLSTNITLSDIISKLHDQHGIDVSVKFFSFYLNKVEISTPSDDDTIYTHKGASLQIVPRVIHNTNDREEGYKYDSVKVYNDPLTSDEDVVYRLRGSKRFRDPIKFTEDYNEICKRTIFKKKEKRTREEKIWWISSKSIKIKETVVRKHSKKRYKYKLYVKIPVDVEEMERYRIVLLIEGYARIVASSVILPMDIVNVVFMYKYDKDALEREYNIQKCKEIVTKVKFIKTVQKWQEASSESDAGDDSDWHP